MSYRVIIGTDLLEKAEAYADAIASQTSRPGRYLASLLPDTTSRVTAMELLQLLLDTKRPQIFAESAVAGDGSDWHATELHLLGDISIAAEVEVFDDGRHRGPIRHDTSFRGTLVFTCGALLASGHRTKTPDLMEVAPNGNLDQLAYNRLYSRRLRPVFNWIQKTAEDRQRNALVTIPGLGCGQFAGRFHGRLGPILQTALESLLAELAEDIPNVRVVIFDPYNECTDFERVFGNTGFRVRPLLTSRNAHPQLCPPQDYAEDGENLSECDLYSLVAWDQVSWPGNDFYAGSRATDDGVKAAATSSMHAITGIQGHYEPVRGMYLPPGQYLTWGDCVRHNKIRLRLGGPDIGVN